MIYEKIKKLCEEKSISMRSIEQKLGFGNGTISKWETSTPSAEKLKAVADELEKPMEYFLE